MDVTQVWWHHGRGYIELSVLCDRANDSIRSMGFPLRVMMRGVGLESIGYDGI